MRLVIQGKQASFQHLSHIHQLSGSSQQFTQTAEFSFYLPKQLDKNPAILLFCQQAQLDCAYVADTHVLPAFGLAVMDMDSTLIAIECIDEIADMQGIKPQVAAITEQSMRGEIDFTESLKRRVSLLAGLPESALHQVVDQRLQLSPGAVDWINTCKAHGIKTAVVSGGFDFFTNRVKAMLGLDYAHANRLEIIDGKLTGKLVGNIVDAQAKANFLIDLRNTLNLKPEQAIAIGDGANDLKMMAVAACGVAYRAKPVVQQQATYAINHNGLEAISGLFKV